MRVGLAARDDQAPPGYMLVAHELTPDPTVGGFIARGASVSGRCDMGDCHRRARMDLNEMARIAGPTMLVEKVARYMRCQRIEGCGFRFNNLPPRLDISLDRFMRRANVRLRLHCAACGSYTHRAVDKVIAWLVETGQGTPGTYVSDFERKLQTRCRCGQVRWAVSVIIFDTSSPRWAKDGEAVFQDKPYKPPADPKAASS